MFVLIISSSFVLSLSSDPESLPVLSCLLSSVVETYSLLMSESSSQSPCFVPYVESLSLVFLVSSSVKPSIFCLLIIDYIKIQKTGVIMLENKCDVCYQ